MSSRLVAVFTPFEDLTDPRIARTRAHELFDLVVVALCGTLAGADSWTDIERFGNERLDWLRTFLPLAEGIPSHDTFGRVFAMLDPAELVACVAQWLQDIGRDIGTHIAIDGKTLRGSGDAAAERNPLRLVSVWASEARLTLGQIAVDAKSNEITAIPLLLELLDLTGATVTIDATGCHEEIAAQIVTGGGDLSSQAPRVKEFAKVARGHWSIERQLHRVLDVTFSEDASRIRQQQAPQTSAVLCRLAVSILSQDTMVRGTLQSKHHRACLSTEMLERTLLEFAAI